MNNSEFNCGSDLVVCLFVFFTFNVFCAFVGYMLYFMC